jgi:hypothetical protein
MCTIIIHFNFSSSDEIETVPLKVFLTCKYVHEVRRWSIEKEKLDSFYRLWHELRDISPLLAERIFTITRKGKQKCNYFYLLATGILK